MTSEKKINVWRMAPVKTIFAVLVVPLACILMAFGVMVTRLDHNDVVNQERVASLVVSWVSDRLKLATPETFPEIIDAAQKELSVDIGLFDGDGKPLVKSNLTSLGDAQFRGIISGKTTQMAFNGKDCFVRSERLEDVGRIIVMVPLVKSNSSKGVLLRHFWVIAGVLSLVALLFGFSLGLDYYFMMRNAIDKLDAAVYNIYEKPICISYSYPEIGDLSRAIGQLSERFEGELDLFEDAFEEVETLDETRKDLLSAVSLELREPLDNIAEQSRALLAGRYGPLSEVQTEDVRIVEKATERLRDMVEEILDFSSILSGTISFDPYPVDLTQVVHEVVETSRGQVAAKKVNIRFEYDENEPVLVSGNKQRMWQVVTNLTGNAIKFTDQGEITVSVYAKDGKAYVAVEDTGIGISASELGSIFDNYGQVGGRPHKKKGTGLGLAICKRLVELHKGEIDVRSNLGDGSTFTVILPEVDNESLQ